MRIIRSWVGESPVNTAVCKSHTADAFSILNRLFKSLRISSIYRTAKVTMEASTQLIRRPARRVIRMHHLMIGGLLFLMAASPSILFVIISEDVLSPPLTYQSNIRSRSLVTSTKSADSKSLYKNSSSTADADETDQSCYTVYISKHDVSAALPTEEIPNDNAVGSVVNHFLLEGNVPKGSSIVLVTDDESVLHEIQRRPNTEYRWTVLLHKPSFIHFLSTLTDMKQAVKCDTVVYSTAKRSRFLLLLFGTLKSTGRSVQSVLVNLASGTKRHPRKAAILYMKDRNPHLRKQKKSEIGFRLCQYCSGNRQGFCDRWFH
jgi:hypothetical protein